MAHLLSYIFFLMNVFFALKGSKLFIIIYEDRDKRIEVAEVLVRTEILLKMKNHYMIQ